MRIKCISCDALARLVYMNAANSPHIIDVEMLELGLHDKPDNLRQQLQEKIDACSVSKYDAIVIIYGLCGKSTDGLIARDIPVIMPRAHDCITLFLGSRSKYLEQHEACPGTYWYSLDYIERSVDAGRTTTLGGVGVDMGMDLESVYDTYVEKYGKENADYLMEVMGEWQKHYSRAVFLDMHIGNSNAVELHAKEESSRRGWVYERIEGDAVLVKNLLWGDWESSIDDYVVIHPGNITRMTNDERIIQAVDIGNSG